MKNISVLSENFSVLKVKFSIYILNRRVFIMVWHVRDVHADNEDSGHIVRKHMLIGVLDRYT